MSFETSKVYRLMCKIGDNYDRRQKKYMELTEKHGKKIVIGMILVYLLIAILGMFLLPETVVVRYTSGENAEHFYPKNYYLIRTTVLCFASMAMYYFRKLPIWAFVTIAQIVVFALHVITRS